MCTFILILARKSPFTLEKGRGTDSSHTSWTKQTVRRWTGLRIAGCWPGTPDRHSAVWLVRRGGCFGGGLCHRFDREGPAQLLVENSNVIVALPDTLEASDELAADYLCKECATLFVDEAHHLAAQTWQRVRDRFAGKKVVQFTATPFTPVLPATGSVVQDFVWGLWEGLITAFVSCLLRTYWVRFTARRWIFRVDWTQRNPW